MKLDGSSSYKLKWFFVFAIVLLYGLSPAAQEHSLEESNEKRLNRLQPPVQVMDSIGLESGMTIGEIGAGRGRYTVWFAVRVGEKGKVYANDIDQESLEYTARRCERLGLDNVEIVPGEVEDPKLPENTLDIAFMINTYHHLEKPLELLRNIKPGLKADARLIIVEHDPEKTGNSRIHSTPRDKLIEVALQAGFELEKIETFLEIDNIYFFTLPKRE